MLEKEVLHSGSQLNKGWMRFSEKFIYFRLFLPNIVD